MKKIAVFLAAVFGAATLLSAAPVTVSGTIESITVSGLWNLTVGSTRINGDTGTESTLGAGNVGFGTIPLTSDAITADTTATNYKKVAHREATDYTMLKFSVSNNSSDTFQVTGTLSGTIYNIPLPTGTSGEAGADSTIHITTGYEYKSATEIATQYQSNVVQNGVARSMLSGTAVSLYVDAAGNGIRSDVFRAYVALDFLPIIVPEGTYTGTTTWTLSETIS